MKEVLFRLTSRSLCTLYFVLCTLPTTHAQSGLRTNDSVFVENAYVVSTSVVADPKGLVYVEFAENTYIVHREPKTRFSGEILPPTIITEPPYLKKPKGRIREIVSFEVASDTLEDLAFIDKFDIAHQRNRQRAALLNGGTLPRTKLVKVIVPLFQEYGSPALWEYTGQEKEPWIRLGGRTEETNEQDINLFIASLNGTGVYVLFDEDPAPDEADMFIPYEEIQKAPEAPYTSVQPYVPEPEQPPLGDQFFNPSSGEVNIPVDEFGNAIDPSQTDDTSITPVSENPSNTLGAFGVAPEDFGLSGNFNLNPNKQPKVTGETLRTPDLNSESQNTSDPFPTDNSFPSSDPFIPSTQPSLENNTTTQDRVDELIRQRLLQGALGDRETKEILNTFNIEEDNTPPTETLSNDTISDVLLSQQESIETPDIESTLLSTSTLESEETYSSAPEGDLPRTGKKKIPLFSIVLSLLLLSTGFWYWKKQRQPKQMKIRMK